MIELPSKVEGKQFGLFELEQKLKPIGYTIGGNWDYDHGAFDYKLNDEDGYQFMRLPFQAIDGQLDANNCTVKLGRPFLLAHIYEAGLDDEGSTGTFSGTLNQFQEPVDKDASIPDKYRESGKVLVQELEMLLLTD
ncbi:YugN-like family protein [Bacillus sp. sid0103]|uniref:YugN-like family protein n=1 Tax=Bacillus sp. sid0103 TaxID=2856337 RepID=UPI001C47FD09|nr:YugN-like family protein [Bacillus sp. sid0103]MBV7507027.1 YugN-like family protein [Bacillus sp. sid0103]